MKTTFNPYKAIGKQLADGMDIISTSLTKTSTVDDLVDVISKYIKDIYFKEDVSIGIDIEIKSVAYSVINTYLNSTFGGAVSYDSNQHFFISLMLNCPNKMPVNSLTNYLKDVEDSIVTSGLSITAQTPLLLSILDGITINSYWEAEINKPGKWDVFFDKNPAINYANIPFWAEACMKGSLIGANASPRGMISTTIDIVTVQIISSLIGALSIGAGKVVFNWTPKINLSYGGSGNIQSYRRENSGPGSYTESDIHVSYTADFIKGNKARYYFN